MDKDRCSIIAHSPEDANNPRFLEAAEALRQLCEMFGVAQQIARPAPSVGEKLELDPSKSWKKLSNELWDLLVPLDNQAETLQGEAIRITGKVAYEVYDNGGINWEPTFNALLQQFLEIISSEVPLSADELALAKKAVGDLRGGKSTEASDVLREAAVHWVLANPVLRANTMPFLGR